MEDGFFFNKNDVDSGYYVQMKKEKDIVTVELCMGNDTITNSYSITNGILYTSPIGQYSMYFNKTENYEFWWWLYQHISPEFVIFAITKGHWSEVFKVPFSRFIEMGIVVSSGDSLTKKLYIPAQSLRQYKLTI